MNDRSKWSYKAVRFGSDQDPDEIAETLDEYGRDGWQMCGVTPGRDGENVFYMRRTYTGSRDW